MTVVPNDPFGPIREDKKMPEGLTTPRESQLAHSRSDVDSSQFAQHHTIGLKHNQVAAGDHVHNGGDSRLVGTGLALTVTGAKGGNVALTNLLTMLGKVIKFTDTTT